MTFDEARELAAALGLGSDVNARALISDALKAAFDNGLAAGQRSPAPGVAARVEAPTMSGDGPGLPPADRGDWTCAKCGRHRTVSPVAMARMYFVLKDNSCRCWEHIAAAPPVERVTPPGLLPGGREPTRFMVVRKQDTEPWEVTGFPHRGDAEVFYDRASEQWTETYLVAVLKGPPDVVGFAPVPGAERVTVPSGEARDFSGREGEPSSFDLPPSLYRCNHCGATRSSKQLLARLGACKPCGEGTMERVKAAVPAGDAGAPTSGQFERECESALLQIGKRHGLKGCDGGGSDEPCYFPRCLADGCDGGCDGGGEFPPPPPEECADDGCLREPLRSYQFCHEYLNVARAADGLPPVNEKGDVVACERCDGRGGWPCCEECPEDKCYPCPSCKGTGRASTNPGSAPTGGAGTGRP